MKTPRILIIDDNESIHKDFQSILAPKESNSDFNGLHSAFLGVEDSSKRFRAVYDLDSAFQGEQGFEMVQQAVAQQRPYSLAFIDMRMPPGWDGLTALTRIFECDPHIQAVICTAFSDKSWFDIQEAVGHTDRLLILKKPFDNAEVAQLAAALTHKYELAIRAALRTEELEHMVEARTAEIRKANHEREIAQEKSIAQERQLLQKQKLESLGLLAGGVAHDVNNYLHIAQNCIDFSVADVAPSQQHLETAGQAIRDAAVIVSQILDFSRRTTGQLVEIVPQQAIDRCAQLLNPLLKDRFLLKIHLDPRLSDFVIDGDASSLEQIVLNLCTNARDAMPDGGEISITANVTQFSPTDDSRPTFCDLHSALRYDESLTSDTFVVIEVSDAGTGIPLELQSRILDPFYTTKDVGSGTGLGLSTVAAIVRRHKGILNIESAVNEGSTFQVALPARKHVPSRDTAMQQFITPDSGHVEGAGRKVLLVDDSAVIRKISRLTLEASGFTVVEAVDGVEAVEVAHQHRDLCLLVMDVQMPRMNGRQAVEQINGNGRELPVIFCSGFDPSAHREAADNSDSSITLSKPFEGRQLMAAVKKALQGYRSYA